ncbi:MFS transporter [Azospirillum humicireducens]|uniref:MFS transporter n=1 Tax=Azospirillum humicireducens TaxID=1226968 RepID=A0A160JCZ7_9PROT|nr:MFS transporter [Azospirillum humicireducens]ANC90552.1 MFS transporter [Azospirillum humicireducens]
MTAISDETDRPGATAATAAAPWRDHCAMLVCAMTGFSSLYLTQSLGGELQRLHGLSVQQCAALLTATTLGLALASPLAGLLVQQLGLRRALVVGLTLLGLLDAGLAVAGGFAELLVLRAMQGAAMPMVLSALLAGIERQPSTRTALGMSATYVMGTVCGGIVGRLLPASLIPSFGWSAAFLAMALLHGIALLLALALAFKGSGPARQPAGDERSRRRGYGAWSLPAVYAGGFALLFSQIAVFTFIAFRLAEPPFGWSTAMLGSLYLVFLPSLVFLHGTRRVVSRIGHGRTVAAAALLSWIGLLMTLAGSALPVVAGLVVFSTAVFFVQAVLAHALSLCGGASGARASGGYLFFYYLGGSLGSLVPALLWQRFGWAGCLALIALLQLAAAGLIRLANARARPAPASSATHNTLGEN